MANGHFMRRWLSWLRWWDRPAAAPDKAEQRTAARDQGRFDKFTERARRVLWHADKEALRLNHNFLGPEHLLLGLIREGDGVAGQILARLNVDPSVVRQRAEFNAGPGARTAPDMMALTPRTKKAILLAVDEARRMGHRYVGTEHLLLGLVREGEGISSNVLQGLSLQMETVRQSTLDVLRERGGDETTSTTALRPVREALDDSTAHAGDESAPTHLNESGDPEFGKGNEH
jgi:ATP-dependent Clp protease ATP-binding subunit ClpC